MRAGIIISLVVVGGIVVIAPIFLEYRLEAEYQGNVVRLLEKPGATSVNLFRNEISSAMKFGCWSTGTVMIVAGIVLTIREQRLGRPPRGEQSRGSLARDDRPRPVEPGSGDFGVQPRSGL